MVVVSRHGWRGEGGKRKGDQKEIKMYYIHVPTPHKESKHYVLHIGICKLLKIVINNRCKAIGSSS